MISATQLMAESRSAVAAAGERKRAVLDELTRQRVKAEAEFLAFEQQAERDVLAEIARRESALAADWHPRMVELLTAYFNSPGRAIAREICSSVAGLEADATEQLGRGVGSVAIAIAAMATVHRSDRDGYNGSLAVGAAAGQVLGASLAGSIVAVELALAQLELGLSSLRVGSDEERELHAVLAPNCISVSGFGGVLAKFDATKAAEKQAAFAARYQAPPQPRSTDYRGRELNPDYGKPSVPEKDLLARLATRALNLLEGR